MIIAVYIPSLDIVLYVVKASAAAELQFTDWWVCYNGSNIQRQNMCLFLVQNVSNRREILPVYEIAYVQKNDVCENVTRTMWRPSRLFRKVHSLTRVFGRFNGHCLRVTVTSWRKAEDMIAGIIMTHIDALDNYIMVKVFKYLDYCELAKSSRVSKRFRDIIRANRKSLARLYVDRIQMTFEPGLQTTFTVQAFNQKLSYHAYNEWVLHNQHLNQSQFDVQVAGNQIANYGVKTNYLLVYSLIAEVNYKYPNNGDTTTVFDARVPLVLSHKNLLLNQHFIRLIADPNIYINHLQLCLQNDVLSLLSQAIGNQNRNRLRCEKLRVILNGNTQNIINWVNNHVCCNELNIGRDYSTPDKPWKYYDKLILDLCLNGAHITSALNLGSYDLSNVVVNFVQKFIDLKGADQYQIVQSIRSWEKKMMSLGVEPEILKVLESNCATLPRKVIVPKIDNFLEELRKERSTEHVFEFINNNILKKLQVTFIIFGDEYLPLPNFWQRGVRELRFSLIVTDL